MNKSYTGRYPERKQEKHRDINKALFSMLNCRRYLAGHGFEEVFSNLTGYNNPINNLSGKVIFPDGSELGSDMFITMNNSSERDALLERMIEKNIRFKRRGIGDLDKGYLRNNVVRTTFGGGGYNFELSVIDTTKEGVIFPASLFIFSPKNFSFRYEVLLSKNVITDKDLEDFDRYRQGLEDSLKHENLLAYAPQVTPKQQIEIEVPLQKIDFINPWEIEVPKIGGKKNE